MIALVALNERLVPDFGLTATKIEFIRDVAANTKRYWVEFEDGGADSLDVTDLEDGHIQIDL